MDLETSKETVKRLIKALVFAFIFMTLGAIYYGVQTETLDQCRALYATDVLRP